ncbi:MAG TPA: hypothetical protein VEQ66_09085 [Propionibacteriaceae bacterium]|nr:hypothetical protein [Propionibacteriaceae bacterium]
MAFADKIKSLVNSPKGQQAIQRGRAELSKPENQRKIRTLLNRVGKRR